MFGLSSTLIPNSRSPQGQSGAIVIEQSTTNGRTRKRAHGTREMSAQDIDRDLTRGSVHSHTHTYMYICIYVEKKRGEKEREEGRERQRERVCFIRTKVTSARIFSRRCYYTYRALFANSFLTRTRT